MEDVSPAGLAGLRGLLGSALHLIGGGYCQQGALILLLILPPASPVCVGVIVTAGLEEGTAATHTSQAGKLSQPSDPPTVKQHHWWGLLTHKQPSTQTITDTQLPTEPTVSAEAHCQGQACRPICVFAQQGRKTPTYFRALGFWCLFRFSRK